MHSLRPTRHDGAMTALSSTDPTDLEIVIMKFSAWAWACARGSTLLLGDAMAQGLLPSGFAPSGSTITVSCRTRLGLPVMPPLWNMLRLSRPPSQLRWRRPRKLHRLRSQRLRWKPAPAAPVTPAAPAVSPSYGSCDVGCSLGCDVNGCDSYGCDSCVGGCGLFGHGELGEPWTLKSHLGCSPCSPWDVAGFIQFGYQDNPDGSFSGNGPFLNQREWDNLNLNQGYVYVSRTADGSNGLAWGGRMDAFYGVDGNEGQAFGNVNAGHFDYLNGWDHGSYEWAMPQLYGEVAYGDTSVKAGRFYTIQGYEVVMSTGNFFLSRQLTFWNSEPFTHTGALATTKLTDKLSVWNGWVLGMDTGFYQYARGNAYRAVFTYQLDDDTSFILHHAVRRYGLARNGAINSWILTKNWARQVQHGASVRRPGQRSPRRCHRCPRSR